MKETGLYEQRIEIKAGSYYIKGLGYNNDFSCMSGKNIAAGIDLADGKDETTYLIYNGGRCCGKTFSMLHRPYSGLKKQYRKIKVTDELLKQVEHVDLNKGETITDVVDQCVFDIPDEVKRLLDLMYETEKQIMERRNE